MPDMTYGVASALSPLVRRIVAPNPSMMTGPGTNTYLVGIDEVAVIDPGPDDKGHIEAIIGASMKERVRWVVLTHTHIDHAPGAHRLAKATGAKIVAFKKDAVVTPDIVLKDGGVIEGTEWGLEAIHTPGHASNHLCFFLEEERVLFTGDHIMGGSTVVIAPPDGNMSDYLRSLERLKKRRIARICPGHGDVIEEPKVKIDEYIKHRLMRERQIVKELKLGPARITELVAKMYADVPEALHPVASYSVLAHLLKLKAEGKAAGRDMKSIWKLSA